MYVRYGHMVNYPEIAELLILFAQKYIEEKHSKYFSSIRIIPRMKDEKPSEFLFDENTKFYPVQGKEFDMTLHTYATPVFFSHSSNKQLYGTPNIISR